MHVCTRYRARNVSWYRTNFSVESDERSGALWLEFDGVYRAADFWLNGVLLGHHTSGYVQGTTSSPVATLARGAARES